MRKKHNLSNFPHDTKTTRERAAYREMVSGSSNSEGTVEDSALEGFADTTLPIAPKDPQALEEPKERPYESLSSWLKSRWTTALFSFLSLIALAFFGWLASTAYSNSKELVSVETRVNTAESDINDLQQKYEKVNDMTTTSTALLQEIQNDLAFLRSKVVK